MQKNFRACLRGPWALAGAVTLMCYALTPLTWDGRLDLKALANLADLALLLLSFPLGLLTALVLGQFGYTDLPRSQIWALLLACAYFQWFQLVPYVLRHKPAPVATLNLAGDEQVGPAAAAPELRPADPQPARPAAGNPHSPHFNEVGRTPLERALEGEV